MNILQLKEELASVETLVLDGLITRQRGDAWKEKILEQYEGEKFPNAQSTSQPVGLPTDFAHFPGRMVAGIFNAIKMINPERCAGQAPEQKQHFPEYNTRESRRGPPTIDDIPEMYK